jgi:Protein of unknown function (DUF2690)
MRKLLLALPAVLALSAFTLSATPANAAARAPNRPATAAGCYASGCNGLDPHLTGCDATASTVDHATYWSTSQGEYLTIYLRYSTACDANWAAISPAPASWQFKVENTLGNYWVETVGYRSSYWYGNMVNGSVLARACFLNGVCTGYH